MKHRMVVGEWRGAVESLRAVEAQLRESYDMGVFAVGLSPGRWRFCHGLSLKFKDSLRGQTQDGAPDVEIGNNRGSGAALQGLGIGQDGQ